MEMESQWLSSVAFQCQSSWIIWDCLVPYACSKCSNDYFVVSDSTSANMILIPKGSISHSSIRQSSRSFRYESWVSLQWIIWTSFTNLSLSSTWFSISRIDSGCMHNVSERKNFLNSSLLVEVWCFAYILTIRRKPSTFLLMFFTLFVLS